MPLYPLKKSASQGGFTLIELIMVIVLLGIMGMMGSEFISLAFKGFADSDIRTEIFEEGQLALTRMERELRNTIPNAIQPVNGAQAIQFGVINETVMATPTGVFGLYTEPASIFPINAPAEGLTDANATSTPLATWYISVYNRNWTDFSGGGRIFVVTSVTGPTMFFASGQQIDESSPRQRYYVVDEAIQYSWNNVTGVLSRAEAPVTDAGIGAYDTARPLAGGVTNFNCFYTPGSLTRNAVVSIDFTISRQGTVMNFHKEVGIRNVP